MDSPTDELLYQDFVQHAERERFTRNMSQLNIRASEKASIMRIKSETEQESYAPDRVQIEHTLRQLETHCDRFTNAHLELLSVAKDDEMPAHNALLEQIEQTYDHVCIRLRRLLPPEMIDRADTESARSYAHPPDVRLDPIKLPTFDGRQENWLAFRDLFESLVHSRADIDDKYKLSRLRQCISAEAVPMMGGVYTGGYELLWKELKRRYDNPRRLIEAHVYRLFDLPTHPEETQRNIRNVIDCTRGMLRALDVLELPTGQWDALLFPLLLRKLPANTGSQWALANKGDDVPVVLSMLVDIEGYADQLHEPAASTTTGTATRSCLDVQTSVISAIHQVQRRCASFASTKPAATGDHSVPAVLTTTPLDEVCCFPKFGG